MDGISMLTVALAAVLSAVVGGIFRSTGRAGAKWRMLIGAYALVLFVFLLIAQVSYIVFIAALTVPSVLALCFSSYAAFAWKRRRKEASIVEVDVRAIRGEGSRRKQCVVLLALFAILVATWIVLVTSIRSEGDADGLMRFYLSGGTVVVGPYPGIWAAVIVLSVVALSFLGVIPVRGPLRNAATDISIVASTSTLVGAAAVVISAHVRAQLVFSDGYGFGTLTVLSLVLVLGAIVATFVSRRSGQRTAQ